MGGIGQRRNRRVQRRTCASRRRAVITKSHSCSGSLEQTRSRSWRFRKRWCDKLDKSTKVLIVGAFAGALTYGLGQVRAHRLERRVQELQTACVAEGEAEAKGQGTFSALANAFRGKLQCDPVELAKSGEHVGIQGQLAVAQRDVWRWSDWPFIVCIAILLACSLPWLWYFLLRRIRELREAITGK